MSEMHPDVKAFCETCDRIAAEMKERGEKEVKGLNEMALELAQMNASLKQAADDLRLARLLQ